MRFWVNDGIVESRDAVVSVLDHGFTVADGVFETLVVRRGRPFALTRHLRRLSASALGLGLPEPDLAMVREAVHTVCEVNAHELAAAARMRITYTSGPAPLGSERGSQGCSLVVAVAPAGTWPPAATVAVVPWPRNERSAVAGLKTTAYAENVVMLEAAHHLGAGEALMPNTRGSLCEGTGSNVFVVMDGRVLTPPLSSGCLAGITRELVLEWCSRELPVEEADLPIGVLHTAEEAFLTSSTRDVQPIGAIVGEGFDRRFDAPGELTARASAIFAAMTAESPDP